MSYNATTVYDRESRSSTVWYNVLVVKKGGLRVDGRCRQCLFLSTLDSVVADRIPENTVSNNVIKIASKNFNFCRVNWRQQIMLEVLNLNKPFDPFDFY